MNLYQLKQEAREEVRNADWATNLTALQYHQARGYIEDSIDRVVEEVEKAVSLAMDVTRSSMNWKGLNSRASDEYWLAINDVCAAFNQFRGEGGGVCGEFRPTRLVDRFCGSCGFSEEKHV